MSDADSFPVARLIRDPQRAAPDTSDRPPASAQEEKLLAFFHQNRWNLLVATAATSPVIVAVSWPLALHGSMTWFLVLHQLSVIVMALTFALPVTARPVQGLPPLASLVMSQVLLSSAIFFDPEAARNADFAFGIAIVLYAYAAGTVATLGPLRRMARVALVCLFAPYIAGCFASGHPGLATGTIFFLIMIAGVAVEKNATLIDELLMLRQEASQRADQAEAIATTDPLTGLTNRYGLAQIDGALLKTETSGIFLDLDDFKEVNDSLGHKAGDEVLVEVSRRLRRYVRPSDTIARLGGDEFFVLLFSNHEIPVMTIANRIREAIEQPIEIGGTTDRSTGGSTVQVSASLGLSRQSPGLLNLEALIQNADEALYMAKSLGRNQVFASSVRLNASSESAASDTFRPDVIPGTHRAMG